MKQFIVNILLAVVICASAILSYRYLNYSVFTSIFFMTLLGIILEKYNAKKIPIPSTGINAQNDENYFLTTMTFRTFFFASLSVSVYEKFWGLTAQNATEIFINFGFYWIIIFLLICTNAINEVLESIRSSKTPVSDNGV